MSGRKSDRSDARQLLRFFSPKPQRGTLHPVRSEGKPFTGVPWQPLLMQ